MLVSLFGVLYVLYVLREVYIQMYIYETMHVIDNFCIRLWICNIVCDGAFICVFCDISRVNTRRGVIARHTKQLLHSAVFEQSEWENYVIQVKKLTLTTPKLSYTSQMHFL